MDIERDLEFARKCVMVSTADIVTKTRVDETLQAIARQSVKSEEVAEAIEWAQSMEVLYEEEQMPECADCVKTAITALQAYQPWVSVENRLPEEGAITHWPPMLLEPLKGE